MAVAQAANFSAVPIRVLNNFDRAAETANKPHASPEPTFRVKAAGGRSGVVPANGKIVGLIGEPPKRFAVSEWESLEKLQAYYK